MVNPRVNPDQMNQSYSLPTTSSEEALESESPTPSPYFQGAQQQDCVGEMRFILVSLKKTQNNPTQKKLLMEVLSMRVLMTRELLVRVLLMVKS